MLHVYTSFPVIAPQSSAAATVKGFAVILSGEADKYPEGAFFNVGTIDDVAEKAKTL